MEVQIARQIDATPQGVADYLACCDMRTLNQIRLLLLKEGLSADFGLAEIAVSLPEPSEPHSY